MKVKDLVIGNHYTDTSYPGQVYIYKYMTGARSMFPGEHRFSNADPKGLGICCTPDQIETDTAPIEDEKHES